MVLTHSEIFRHQPADLWFCLKAQPKREHIAVAFLRQNSEVEAFCPRLRFRRHTTRGPVWFVESMFPGYLFSKFNYATFHRRVIMAPGISGFVRFGDGLGLLPDALIAEIKGHMGEDEIVEINQGLESGQYVEVAQGPFQGFEALVTRFIAARDRVEILIEWMGRSLHAELDVADLVPVAGPKPRVLQSQSY
jgi:transcriptional antiterminator RfaH